MKKIFLDTNILMDFIEGRHGANDAGEVLRYANAGKIDVAASSLTYTTIAYIVGKKHSQQEVCQTLDSLSTIVSILDLDAQSIQVAIKKPCRDFEDMVQYQCAIANRYDAIITNNKKDFIEFCKLPLYTAAEFLSELKK